MILLINYANYKFIKSQKLNSKTGMEVGGFDKVISYSPKDIDHNFYKKNKEILTQRRGGGYWLWKPYIIDKSLKLLQDGDFLFYADSGSFFIDSVKPLCKILKQSGQKIMQFDLPLGAKIPNQPDLHRIEKVWTKRDLFTALDCDTEQYTHSKQRQGGFCLFEKSHQASDFVKEWLHLSQQQNLITDSPSKSPNYDDFINHRHDQSIWSLLGKKHQLSAYRSPNQYGNRIRHLYPNSPYSQILQLTKKRNIMPLSALPEHIMNRTLSKTKTLLKIISNGKINLGNSYE